MSAAQVNSEEFGKIRSFLWPIHRHELKKFLPMLLIFFLLFFNYNILRPMKDSLVVTAKGSGAEAIPFIKMWVMFPCAILMTFIFTRLTNRFSQEKVFYAMTSLFLGYFFMFAFLLYPMKDALQLNALADGMQQVLPQGLMGFIAMFRNWTFTSFYVMSELWGSVIIFLLFWGFANRVTLLGEAKRFYGLFGIGLNFSGIIAGQASVILSKHVYNPALPLGNNSWEQGMMLIITLFLICGIVAMGLFKWMHSSVLEKEEVQTDTAEKKGKKKLSVREAFNYIIQSRYLLCLACIVLAYNLVINLVEVVWKSEIKALHPDTASYNLYMSQVNTMIGIFSTVIAIACRNSVRKLGWSFTAMLTPIVLLITSVAFFGAIFAKNYFPVEMMSYVGAAPLAIVVFMGSLQNVLCRATKYTVFDSTKEMAYIPLSEECKVKGKAAIDGVCSRMGKSGGSLIHQTLLIFLGSIPFCVPYVAAILFVVVAFWMFATRWLGRQFNALTGKIHQINVPVAVEQEEDQEEEREELLAGVAS